MNNIIYSDEEIEKLGKIYNNLKKINLYNIMTQKPFKQFINCYGDEILKRSIIKEEKNG